MQILFQIKPEETSLHLTTDCHMLWNPFYNDYPEFPPPFPLPGKLKKKKGYFKQKYLGN